MTTGMQRSFSARMPMLPSALAWVEQCGAQQGLNAEVLLRLALIVEELFTNTVLHGHGGDHDALVSIALQVEAGQPTLHYGDRAPPFDPLRYLAESAPDLDAPPEHRPIGRMGLPMVAQMAEQFDYAYIDGCNCIRLRLRRQP